MTTGKPAGKPAATKKLSSAEKQARVAEQNRLRNKSVQSLAKTRISKAEALISSGQLELARAAVTTTVAVLDKAAEKGIIHPNNAARRKSRLMKKLNKASTSPAPETKSEGTK